MSEVTKLKSLEADQLVTGGTDPLDKFGCVFFFCGVDCDLQFIASDLYNMLISICVESTAKSECHSA